MEKLRKHRDIQLRAIRPKEARDYYQLLMEKATPIFFSQFWGEDYKNVRYTDQFGGRKVISSH